MTNVKTHLLRGSHLRLSVIVACGLKLHPSRIKQNSWKCSPPCSFCLKPMNICMVLLQKVTHGFPHLFAENTKNTPALFTFSMSVIHFLLSRTNCDFP